MIKRFLDLSETSVFTIKDIDGWLFHYSELYETTHDLFYNKYLFELEDGSKVRLPPVEKKTEEENFLHLYDALNAISKFHKNERYFEEQMAQYQKIKNYKNHLKNWIENNEHLGSDQYACFLLDYLDYDEDDKVEHLKIHVLSSVPLEVYVDRNNFKYTIEFLEAFNALYWT